MSHTTAGVLIIIAATILIIGGLTWAARIARRNHLRLEAVERATGYQARRRRMKGQVAAGQGSATAVLPAETPGLRGWVWIKITWRPPHPGERRKIQANDEQMGWAMTKRGAQKALAREGRPARVRDERGGGDDMFDFLKILLVLVVVSALITHLGGFDVTAGDIVDWIAAQLRDLGMLVWEKLG